MKNCVRLCCYVLVAVSVTTGVSCSRDPNVVKVKYLQNGNRYFEKGKYKEAYIMYRNALKKDPKYGEAYYRLGLTEMKMQRPLEASRNFRRAIDASAEHQEARVQLGELYLLAYLTHSPGWQNLPAMIKTLSDELLRLNPKSAPALRLRGYVELSDGKVPEALATFRQANDLTPLKPEIALPLAQTMFASGQAAEAEKLCRALMEKEKSFGPAYDLLYIQAMQGKRMDEAESVLKLKIANNPKETNYMLQLARHYYALQRPADMRRVLEKVGSKDYADGRLKAGVFYRAIRDYDSAVRQYREGASEDPKRKGDYRRAIAEVLMTQRKGPEAVKILEEALKDDPNDSRAQAMRAQLLLDTGDPKRVQAALNDLQAVVTRMPANAVLRYNLGRALVAKNQLDQARTQFQEAAKLQRNYVPPRLWLAELQMYRRDWGQALQYSSEVLQLDQRNLRARLIRSTALAAVGNREQARIDLAATLKLYPESREAQIQVGLLDLAEKRYPEAEANFSKLYKANPEDLRGLMGITETYALQGQNEKAVQLLKAELGRHPERVEIRLALGNLAARSGQFDLAIEHYQALLKVNPEAGDLYVRVGEVYRKKGSPNEAMAAFRKAKELRPSDPEPHLQLALLLDASGQREQARPIYEQVLKLQPGNAIALNNLAYLVAETGGDLDEALALAERAKQRLPQDLNVADTLGWIYIKKNLSDNAVRVFRELVVKQPETVIYRYHLAMAYYLKGDRVEARKELQAALQKKPTKDEEAKIRQLMGKLG